MDPGLAVGILGTVVTILGFGITIAQLRRTATATEAATTAIGSLKNRMATHDLIAECLNASKALQQGAKSLASKSYGDAVGNLLDAQLSITRISVSVRAPQALKDEAKEISEVLIESITELDDVEEKELNFDAKALKIQLRKFASRLDAQVSSTGQEILP